MNQIHENLPQHNPTKDLADAIDGFIFEPLDTLAYLLRAIDKDQVTGYEVGNLLTLVVRGARSELAFQVSNAA